MLLCKKSSDDKIKEKNIGKAEGIDTKIVVSINI